MKEILVYGLNNVRGGIEKYLMDMQKRLCADVKFVYMVETCESIYSSEIEEYGGEMLFYPGRNPLGNYISGIRDILKKNRDRCDTLYMNLSDMTLDNLIVMRMGLKYRYRVVVQAHAALPPDIAGGLHRLLHRLVVTAGKIIIASDKVKCCAVSDRAGDYLFGKACYSIVAPGIDVPQFAFDSQQRQSIRRKLGLREEYVYGFIGRLVEIKNPGYLLKIFHRITQKSERDCRLLLVGDGPLREDLHQQAERLGLADKVIFTGETNNPAAFYQAMDYMILPSQSEGLSLVAIEAQACGLPIACSAGRFPGTIALTPLVNFVPLEDGEEAWADACIAHAKQFADADRGQWNRIVFDSCFEIKNAAESLKRMLCEGTDMDQKKGAAQ